MRTLTLILLCPILSGCIFVGGGRKIVFNEGQRLSVSFASAAASDQFYDGMARGNEEDYYEAGGIVIFGLGVMGGATFHETEFYNAQVRLADVNRNGVIDEVEAERYFKRMTSPHMQ